jgi:outer membrane protein assembly factor BamB
MVALVALLALGSSSGTAATKAGGDWTRFGYDAARSASGPAATGITAANVGKLVRQRVVLDGTVDSSPIYLRAVPVAGRTRDVFFVTTTYGKTRAIDAASGRILWRFTPEGYKSFAGTAQITTATPVADPSRRWIYAAAPNGRIHKLSVASGRETGGWPVTVTRDPGHEKIAAALNFARGLVLVATGGYIGDAPPYQGHVVAITAASGRIAHVWNSLCSDRAGIITPSSCSESGSAIWGRAGVVVAPGTGNLLVATGDGRFDGSRNWGDSVLMLSPTASRLLQNWTPADQHTLEEGDVDLGSTAPAVLNSRLAVQAGKDGQMRLLDLRRLNGRGGHSAATGGQLQTLQLGDGLFSAPAVWRHNGTTWLFVSTFGSMHAYRLAGGRIAEAWTKAGGTSPVVAGGLLYVYDPSGGLNVYRPASGALVAHVAAGSGHWNSPIVTDGRVALPEGDANDHETTGILDIYRLPR